MANTTVPVSLVPSGSSSLCSGENSGAATTASTGAPGLAEAESSAVSNRTRATLSGGGCDPSSARSPGLTGSNPNSRASRSGASKRVPRRTYCG